MVSGRPLLYLSLPGVAFILGVFWFRRRNKNRLTNGEPNAGDKGTNTATQNTNPKNDIKEDLIYKSNKTTLNNSAPTATPPSTVTKAMNINGSIVSADDDNTAAKLFGKSAPITIVQNGRGAGGASPSNHQIDSEELKTKMQDFEHKALRSIDEDFENLSSPVDLPDSINTRVPFYTRNVSVKHEEPVVIKATTTPKISPENSFLESKYVKGGEQKSNNNNSNLCESSKGTTSTTIKASEQQQAQMAIEEPQIIKEQQQQQQQSQQQMTPAQNELTASEQEKDTQIVATTIVNDKRNVDVASPSLSLCSIQSGDSGKGSSLPRSEAMRAKTTYEFFFPNSLVGHLYGRKRTFINQIKAETSANVLLRKNRFSGKVRICAIEGTENEINAALAMIRQRLPTKRYPNFTMQRIHFALPQTIVPLSTESLLNLQLNLIEGINNDVVVSAVISGGHIFVQHPLHPSHPSLAVLQKCLYDSYTSAEAPLLPSIEISAMCVLPVNGIWYRVQIIDQDAEDDQRCIVKFLDFGGYMNVHFNELRQIRSDFMAVPFQATECILSNIEPIDTCWSAEAADIMCKLTKGIVLQAQVAGYNSHNIPEIYLFASLGPNNVIFINKELVARNLAKWVEIRD